MMAQRKNKIEFLRERYPVGSRIKLIMMQDEYSKLKEGDLGTVAFVDDAGTIHVNWDNGSTLGLIQNVDIFYKIS